MLVLTRREGEEVLIGDDVRVMVVHAADGRARLAIKAPQHIKVDRAEKREADENQEEK